MFRKGILFLIALFFMSTVAVGKIAAVGSTSAADELAQLLGSYSTYQANFTQVTYFGNRNGVQKSYGRIMMMRPGKFRWETNKPTRQTIIANGKTLWIYDADLQQATQQTISSQGGTNPAALLSGNVRKLVKRFTIHKIKRRGAIWFQLSPKSRGDSFTLVQMRFRKGRLVDMWVKNNLGQASRFHFYNVRLNARLSANLFIFRPPPGAAILKQ